MSAVIEYTKDQLGNVSDLAKMFAASSYFSDASQTAQAFTKILAGKELGIPPIAAMKDIYIVKGKVSLSATVMAAVIKRSGIYDYKVIEHDNTKCVIEFYSVGKDKSKELLGVSSFTIEDSKVAGLSGENWKKYPKNMLFARALSNGAKWHTPEIFLGSVYTPDEIDSNLNEDSEGNFVETKKKLSKLLKPQTEEVVITTSSDVIEVNPEDITVIEQSKISSPVTKEDYVKVITELCVKTDTNLKGWLKENKISSLEVLDLQSLNGFYSNLKLKAEVKSK